MMGFIDQGVPKLRMYCGLTTFPTTTTAGDTAARINPRLIASAAGISKIHIAASLRKGELVSVRVGMLPPLLTH